MKKIIIEKYGLVGILLMIAILMGIVKFSYKDKVWQTENDNKTIKQNIKPSIQPTPTIETRTLESLEFEKNYPLWDKLPYSGNGFTVDRYIEAKTLAVIPEGLDKKIVIKEVEKWLENNGLATDSHRLVISN